MTMPTSRKTTPPTRGMAPTRIEVQGPTIQQAIQRALVQLQATRSQVRVQVLSEGQPGLFGMRGKKPAQVRVTLKK